MNLVSPRDFTGDRPERVRAAFLFVEKKEYRSGWAPGAPGPRRVLRKVPEPAPDPADIGRYSATGSTLSCKCTALCEADERIVRRIECVPLREERAARSRLKLLEESLPLEVVLRSELGNGSIGDLGEAVAPRDTGRGLPWPAARVEVSRGRRGLCRLESALPLTAIDDLCSDLSA